MLLRVLHELNLASLVSRSTNLAMHQTSLQHAHSRAARLSVPSSIVPCLQQRACISQGVQTSACSMASMAPALPRRLETLSFPLASTLTHGWHRVRMATRAVGGEAATVEAQASTSGSSSRSSSAGLPSLVLITGAYVLPHPEKMAKGGEDWFFISDSMRSMGVADGVGGWAEVGVDAGAYARQLMGHAKDQADSLTASNSSDYKNLCNSLNLSVSSSGKVDVSSESKAVQLQQTILEKAYYKTDVRGSSTACVLVLAGDRVLASNLGDSGFLLVRDGQVAFHSPQQQHDFNFPYQIGSVDSMSDPPQSSQRFELVVQPGDVLILGTDGLWDNCFDEEIMSVVRYCQDVNMAMDKTAQVLAHYARHRASDPKFASPFAYAAFQAGFAYMGGKMDDITVVIARVALSSEVADNPLPGQGGNNHTLPGSKM